MLGTLFFGKRHMRVHARAVTSACCCSASSAVRGSNSFGLTDSCLGMGRSGRHRRSVVLFCLLAPALKPSAQMAAGLMHVILRQRSPPLVGGRMDKLDGPAQSAVAIAVQACETQKWTWVFARLRERHATLQTPAPQESVTACRRLQSADCPGLCRSNFPHLLVLSQI